MSGNAIRSVLDPHGPVADAITSLAWLLFAGGTAIFVVVVALAAWAWLAPVERRRWLAHERLITVGGIAIPVAVLAALLVYTLATGSPFAATGAAPLRIEVVGHQWWWRIRYLVDDRSDAGSDAGTIDFETANEIRIPVGQPVELVLRSDDVLHTVWIPGLAGKLDMIPGRTNRLQLAADREGVHRAPCAEFCGVQHTKMVLTVVAEPRARFDEWRALQRQPASTLEPTFAARCSACHAIRGTTAAGTLGPDLTHVGGRLMLGAGTVDNNRAAMIEWIAHNQRAKPGNLMPDIDDLGDARMQALADYMIALR